jgi:hypothetical protein
MDVCVGLVDTNPMKLEQAQKTSYAPDIGIYSFGQTCKQMLIVQSIQCHVAADCTGHMSIQLTWADVADVAVIHGPIKE